MQQILIYGDSLTWGIIPDTRRRLPFDERWPGVMHDHDAWHSAQGMRALVQSVARAPIEPGMPVPPVLILAPPPLQSPRGTIAPKFAGGEAKCAGLAEAYRQVAQEMGCHFFDAGSVTSASRVDGVHLDADQHALLGQALATVVRGILAP